MKRNIKSFISIMLVVVMILGTVIQGFAKDNKPFEIIDMTVEYTENPIGIDADNIRFGWKMQSNLIGNRQIAYEINVFNGNESVWNSGKVESNISAQTQLIGKVHFRVL